MPISPFGNAEDSSDLVPRKPEGWQERILDPMAKAYSGMARPVTGPDLGPEHGLVFTSPDLHEMRGNMPTAVDEHYQGYTPSSQLIEKGMRDLNIPSRPSPFGPLPQETLTRRPDNSDPNKILRPDESLADWLKRLGVPRPSDRDPLAPGYRPDESLPDWLRRLGVPSDRDPLAPGYRP